MKNQKNSKSLKVKTQIKAGPKLTIKRDTSDDLVIKMTLKG